ncbi:hypothetical protein OUZ56_032199 [Daphnia magna]|uniref:Uncharacterized protein n=1 Tax=Daphnia magna TaxID=35525 RepID=A0ABQ9ZWF6_9CRUS|nr:hypothetical protein OUZ56_032199 [Daphnia magna]
MSNHKYCVVSTCSNTLIENDLKDYNKYCNRTGRYSFKEHIVPHLNLSLSDDVSSTEIQLFGESYETELCASPSRDVNDSYQCGSEHSILCASSRELPFENEYLPIQAESSQGFPELIEQTVKVHKETQVNQLDLLTLKVEHHTTECVSVKPRMRSRGTQVNDNIFGWKLVDAASSPICATRKRKEMTSRNWIVTTPISSNEKNSSTCNHACSTPLKSPAHVNTTRKRKRLTFDESMSPVPCISDHDDESYRLPSTICVSSETSVNLSSPCPFHLRNSHAERERARTVMERHSKIYLGVDQDWLSVLHLITYKMEKCYVSLN